MPKHTLLIYPGHSSTAHTAEYDDDDGINEPWDGVTEWELNKVFWEVLIDTVKSGDELGEIQIMDINPIAIGRKEGWQYRQARIKDANMKLPDYFIDLHHNQSATQKDKVVRSRTEILYAGEKGRVIAERMQQYLRSAGRDTKIGEPHEFGRGRLDVLYKTVPTSLIIEAFFMSPGTDEALLKTFKETGTVPLWQTIGKALVFAFG